MASQIGEVKVANERIISLIEEECLYSIAIAYSEWLWNEGTKRPVCVYAYSALLRFSILDYERSLGLNPPF